MSIYIVFRVEKALWDENPENKSEDLPFKEMYIGNKLNTEVGLKTTYQDSDDVWFLDKWAFPPQVGWFLGDVPADVDWGDTDPRVGSITAYCNGLMCAINWSLEGWV